MTVCRINKGKHHSSCSKFKLHINKNEIKYNVIFENNCVYDLNGDDQFDINKLFGLSYGLHHRNSARFGWRWNLDKNKMEILAYVYRDGKRINEWDEDIVIAEVNTLEMLEMKMSKDKGEYIFTIDNGKTIYKKRIKHGKCSFWGYNLYPYFGGNKKAPHNITIFINN